MSRQPVIYGICHKSGHRAFSCPGRSDANSSSASFVGPSTRELDPCWSCGECHYASNCQTRLDHIKRRVCVLGVDNVQSTHLPWVLQLRSPLVVKHPCGACPVEFKTSAQLDVTKLEHRFTSLLAVRIPLEHASGVECAATNTLHALGVFPLPCNSSVPTTLRRPKTSRSYGWRWYRWRRRGGCQDLEGLGASNQ